MTGVDVRLARVLVALVCAVVGVAACGSDEGEQPTAVLFPSSTAEYWEQGIQPNSVVASDAYDRVLNSLIQLGPDHGGALRLTLEHAYVDDVLSGVCGNRAGRGVYASRAGQQRQWSGEGVEVQQFSGIFAMDDAADAVSQVREVLECEEYGATSSPQPRSGMPPQDSDAIHVVLGVVALPEYGDIDDGLAFCETVGGIEFSCVVILARHDVATRLTVSASSQEVATDLALELADLAALRLSLGK